MTMDQRALERIADIEGMGRQVNEEIARATPPATDPAQNVPFRCECGNDACAEPLAIPRSVYERVREDPMQFLVRPEHVVPEAETVVDRAESFWLIRKNEEVRLIVEASDPRTPDAQAG
jgi:hypothetical protein